MQVKYNGVPTLGLAVIIYLLLYGYLWYHIREVFSFIGELGGAICLNRQIVKETIGVGVNEKVVLRFYQTALSFTSISIFPW